MSTAPWDAAAEQAIAGPLRYEWSAVALVPGVPDPIALDVDSDAGSSITEDEGWVPRVQADITVRIPSTDVLDLLDPRTGVRIGIDAGYVYPGGQRDVHRVAELLVSERSAARPDNTVQLVLESDERLVLDNAPVFWDSDDSEVFIAASTRCYDAIRALLDLALGSTATIVYGADLPRDGLGADVTIAEGDAYWSAIYDIADRIDAQVYHDGLGVWHIVPRPAVASRAVLQLRTGATGTITTSKVSMSRDPWANAVVIRYETGNAYAIANDGPFSTAEVPRKVLTFDRVKMPKGGGARAARALLLRTISRARSYSLTAKSAYWLHTGDTVTVQLPTGPQERHLVATIRRYLDTGLMDVTTRLPDAVTITTGE